MTATSTKASAETRYTLITTAMGSSIRTSAINPVIEAYNAYFPIEANLASDPATGAYRFGAEPWYSEPLLSHDDVIAFADVTG